VRTNIDLDDDLLEQAMKASGDRTKRATVHRALALLINTAAQGRLRRLRGKVRWTGNLDESRQGRHDR
jgi:Arc/MetJ family transcription regulator